jgi:LacI family transcriptional regulator
MDTPARPTLKDVARVAGVSITTVSVVLNKQRDGIRVPEVTRERVRQAAVELGYQPNQMARGLRRGSVQAIGFVTDEVTTTPFAVAMLAAAQEEAARHGHLLYVVGVGHQPTPDVVQSAVDDLLQHQVSALVFAAMYHQRIDPVELMPSTTVFVNAQAARGAFRSIVPDEQAAASAAVREMLEQGHRRIAYLDDDTGTVASGLRLAGYHAALAEFDVEPDPRLHVRIPPMVSGGVRGGELIDLPERDRPTGIFCFNDRAAMGLYRAARRRGLRVPDDLSVVGFDDQEFIASELDPPLTTMRLPHREMGRLAVETVLGLDTSGAGWRPVGDDGGSVALVECPIVRRDSVTGPRA